jgi:hypothetical protein
MFESAPTDASPCEREHLRGSIDANERNAGPSERK